MRRFSTRRAARAFAVLVFASLACAGGAAQAADGERLADPRRGRLLYETACMACHTAQAHWRDKRIVGSWPQLLAQVERWSQAAGQGWGPAEVQSVAAWLNERYYRLP